MEPDNIYNYLAKYLAGEATSQERKQVELWIKESRENKRIYQLLERVWEIEEAASPLDGINVEEVLEDTHQKLSAGSKKDSHSFLPFLNGNAIKYAAAAVLVLGAILSGVLLTQFYVKNSQSELVYRTQIGEVKEFTLRDHSIVTLAPKSRLEIGEEFNKNAREVYLQGEAVFEVQSDTTKPFLVNAGKSVTRVLGTRFGVEAYSDDSRVSVFVEEGNVSVNEMNPNAKELGIILSKGDYARFDEAMKIIERDTGVAQFLSWREGTINLDGESLYKVTQRLKRWYPVEFEFQNTEISTFRLTTEFSSTQSLEDILEAIALALDIDYKRDDQKILFTQNK